MGQEPSKSPKRNHGNMQYYRYNGLEKEYRTFNDYWKADDWKNGRFRLNLYLYDINLSWNIDIIMHSHFFLKFIS